MAKKDKATTPQPFDLESFAAERHEELTNLITSEDLHAIRERFYFGTIEKGETEAKIQIAPELINKSFFHVFAPFYKSMLENESFRLKTLNGFEISGFESGLFLDFILYSIDRLQTLDPFSGKQYFCKGESLFNALQKDNNPHAILHERITFKKDKERTGRSETVLEVSAADLLQLNYFYNDIGSLLPELRHKHTSNLIRYEFSTMGKRFTHPENRVELWRNFYFREKAWGTNLAVLICGLHPKCASYRDRLAYKEIYEHLTQNTDPLEQLTQFPFPVYRITYLYTTVDYFLRHQPGTCNPGWERSTFSEIYRSPQEHIHYLFGDCTVNDSVKTLEQLMHRAFWLMLVSWMACLLPELRFWEGLPNKDQTKDILTAKHEISRLQDELCQLANEQVGKLFGVQLGEDYQNLDKYWPLLLVSEAENPYVKKLLDQRENPGRSRDAAAEIYTTIQAKCHLL